MLLVHSYLEEHKAIAQLIKTRSDVNDVVSHWYFKGALEDQNLGQRRQHHTFLRNDLTLLPPY